MILNCNKKCTRSDGMTNASLSVDDNKVICLLCDEEIDGISEFTKDAMKRNKDVIKKRSSEAFTFKCHSCNKMVATTVINGAPYGEGCETKQCLIKISEMMVSAIESTRPNSKE